MLEIAVIDEFAPWKKKANKQTWPKQFIPISHNILKKWFIIVWKIYMLYN